MRFYHFCLSFVFTCGKIYKRRCMERNKKEILHYGKNPKGKNAIWECRQSFPDSIFPWDIVLFLQSEEDMYSNWLRRHAVWNFTNILGSIQAIFTCQMVVCHEIIWRCLKSNYFLWHLNDLSCLQFSENKFSFSNIMKQSFWKLCHYEV